MAQTVPTASVSNDLIGAWLKVPSQSCPLDRPVHYSSGGRYAGRRRSPTMDCYAGDYRGRHSSGTACGGDYRSVGCPPGGAVHSSDYLRLSRARAVVPQFGNNSRLRYRRNGFIRRRRRSLPDRSRLFRRRGQSSRPVHPLPEGEERSHRSWDGGQGGPGGSSRCYSQVGSRRGDPHAQEC